MGKGRSGVPLGERRPYQRPPPGQALDVGEVDPSRLSRHVWLVDPPGQPGRWPGLLVEWRRSPTQGWQARVLYAVPESDRSGNRVIERWLPGGCLEPVPDA
jgi:hypothetical protein